MATTAEAEAEHKNILGTRERVLEKKKPSSSFFDQSSSCPIVGWVGDLGCLAGGMTKKWVGRGCGGTYLEIGPGPGGGGVYQEFVGSGSGSRLVIEGWVGWLIEGQLRFFFSFLQGRRRQIAT